MFNLAQVALDLGHPDSAVSRATEAVPLVAAGGHAVLAAFAEITVAQALFDTDLTSAAAALLRADRLLSESVGDNGNERTKSVVRLRASVVRHALGDASVGWRELAAALPILLGHGSRDRDEVADVLRLHARYLCARDPASAAVLSGTADRFRRKKNSPFVSGARRGVLPSTSTVPPVAHDSELGLLALLVFAPAFAA